MLSKLFDRLLGRFRVASAEQRSMAQEITKRETNNFQEYGEVQYDRKEDAFRNRYHNIDCYTCGKAGISYGIIAVPGSIPTYPDRYRVCKTCFKKFLAEHPNERFLGVGYPVIIAQQKPEKTEKLKKKERAEAINALEELQSEWESLASKAKGKKEEWERKKEELGNPKPRFRPRIEIFSAFSNPFSAPAETPHKVVSKKTRDSSTWPCSACTACTACR
jgi:hypothetical protein